MSSPLLPLLESSENPSGNGGAGRAGRRVAREASDKVKAKAQALKEHVSRLSDDDDVWYVQSGENSYRVQVGGFTEEDERWATCSCKFGRNNSYRIGCAHALAVLAVIDESGSTLPE